MAQTLIGVATTGMPQPVRSLLGNRLVSTLVMIAAPILLVTGVVSIQWDGTLPKVSVDQQRAQEISVQAKESLQKLREKETGLLSSWPGRNDSEQAADPGSPQDEQPIANLSEILRTLR